MSASPTPPDSERHGLVGRVALVVVGAVFVLFSVGLVAILAVRGVQIARVGSGYTKEDGIMWAVVLPLFSAIAVFGARLVLRGVRGYSKRSHALANADRRLNGWFKRHPYASLLLFTVSACAFVHDAAPAGERALLAQAGPDLLLLGALAILLLLCAQVAVHELGHHLAALLVGFDSRRIQVGFLVLERVGGDWRFAWRKLELAGVLGVNEAKPRGFNHLGPRFAFHAVAGPLASLLAGAVCWRVGPAIAPDSAASALVATLLRLSGAIGVFLGAANLLPVQIAGATPSDGTRILLALRSPQTLRISLTVRAASETTPKRPRDSGVALDDVLAVARSEPFGRHGMSVLALALACDLNDDARMDEILRGLLADEAKLSPGQAFFVHAQASLAEARRDGVDRARAHFERASALVAAAPQLLLVEAGVKLAEGRHEEARAKLDAWDKAVAAAKEAAPVRAEYQWAEDFVREATRVAAAG